VERTSSALAGNNDCHTASFVYFAPATSPNATGGLGLQFPFVFERFQVSEIGF
jgi:hypothetical protein